MSKATYNDLVQELRLMGKVVSELQHDSSKGHTGPLMSLEEAAQYTSRSACSFRRELKLGIWTCIQVGGKGHPKFSPKDLDEDMKVWAKQSKYRRPEKSRK